MLHTMIFFFYPTLNGDVLITNIFPKLSGEANLFFLIFPLVSVPVVSGSKPTNTEKSAVIWGGGALLMPTNFLLFGGALGIPIKLLSNVLCPREKGKKIPMLSAFPIGPPGLQVCAPTIKLLPLGPNNYLLSFCIVILLLLIKNIFQLNSIQTISS